MTLVLRVKTAVWGVFIASIAIFTDAVEINNKINVLNQ